LHSPPEKQQCRDSRPLIDAITYKFFLLASHPHLGRRRDEDLRRRLRSFPVGEYLILYRVEREDVLILHVLHGCRDIEKMLGS
jgi:toxin ParE1/3/4